MYEYKVLDLKIIACEAIFNRLAKEGWKVISVCPNSAIGNRVIATLERDLKEE